MRLCKVTPAMPTWDLSPDFFHAPATGGGFSPDLAENVSRPRLSSSYVLLSGLKLSDTKVHQPEYEPASESLHSFVKELFLNSPPPHIRTPEPSALMLIFVY